MNGHNSIDVKQSANWQNCSGTSLCAVLNFLYSSFMMVLNITCMYSILKNYDLITQRGFGCLSEVGVAHLFHDVPPQLRGVGQQSQQYISQHSHPARTRLGLLGCPLLGEGLTHLTEADTHLLEIESNAFQEKQESKSELWSLDSFLDDL